MKLPRHTLSPGTRPPRTRLLAFTLAETYIASVAFGYIMLAIIGMMLFGMWAFNISATKLTATAGCRQALNLMREQIRSASWVDVGNCLSGPTSFTLTGGTNAGNAVCVYPSTNLTSYSIFYLDTSTGTNNLMEYSYDSNSTTFAVSSQVVASYITNQQIFLVEDWTNNILTNTPQNNRVIAMTLQFSQWEFPIASVGSNSSGAMYDYYQLRTKVTRRCINESHP
jgi:hypothetical protein